MNNPDPTGLAKRLHSALPQTQCTRCGYPDCAAYAQAIAEGKALINQCPPGGAEGVTRLASITGVPALALNPANGAEAPRFVAVIDEAWCVGCTLCLPACPTDAILGSNKMMHTVIEVHCTGCELCLAVCPVDCIRLENISGNQTGWAAWSQDRANGALQRYEQHSLRFQTTGLASALPGQPSAAGQQKAQEPVGPTHTESKQALIQQTLVRAREKAKLQGLAPSSNHQP